MGRVIIGVLLVCGLSVIVGCIHSTPQPETETMIQKMGIVQGKVKIGPLHPGPVRVDEPTEIPVELYATHRIVVLDEDGKDRITEVSISPEGEYHVELAPGVYYLDFQPQDIGMQKSEPVRVWVQGGETVRQDLSIDTGMR